jgi:hypothetical protein
MGHTCVVYVTCTTCSDQFINLTPMWSALTLTLDLQDELEPVKCDTLQGCDVDALLSLNGSPVT